MDNPLVGEDVDVEAFVSGQTLGYFTGEPLTPANQTVFGHNNSNLPVWPASNIHKFVIPITDRIINYTWHHLRNAVGNLNLAHSL